MISRRSLFVAAVAAAAALLSPRASAAEPPPDGAVLPGVPLDDLSSGQKQLLVQFAQEAFCYCGCPHTLAQCLGEHKTCRHAPRMATLAAKLVRAGAKKEELTRFVTGYYASFDRRSKLDTAQFGPPLGSPDAPIAMVEFSDFTCPYCQRVRPVLEAFVESRKGRVKLFYKPFPIESHPGALEAAQAAEWAREVGLFWPMHDALFTRAGAKPDELPGIAREIGGDPEALEAALASGKHVPRIRESQAEARAAKIRGTPTVFLNGRMLMLVEHSEEELEFTLQDEEEWHEHRGWRRD